MKSQISKLLFAVAWCLFFGGMARGQHVGTRLADCPAYATEPVSTDRTVCETASEPAQVVAEPGMDRPTPGGATTSRAAKEVSTLAEPMTVDTICYVVNPEAERQRFRGWGVSLCWWANMCGRWSDEKIDEIVDWLVSPDGLNFSYFRYNIGGGDDPLNRHCAPHHMGMGQGKGLRAEMEGFKDSTGGAYVWERDAAQRKILLKIREKRPDAVFEAFSNSCPYYMTYSGCCSGNADPGKDNLKPEYYEEFAHYLVDVCKHYKEEYGIEFRTLEPFNESMTSYWWANGIQEGCHFDYSSQIAFLKVLAPILKESGLRTVIAASDESSVAQGVEGFDAYREAGILDLIGQWNVHSYQADQPSRSRSNARCREAGIPLCMSEVGFGGTGLAGNLALARKLMDDIRYMMPEYWADWQYVEEGTDQWCLVRGDFKAQTYEKVKNYSVRQHFTKYIKAGYTFLTSLNEQTLVARNAARDTLVIVALNTDSLPVCHRADLSLFRVSGDGITCRMTTREQDLAVCYNYSFRDGVLSYTLPANRIATLIVPLADPAQRPAEPLEAGASYAIVPRGAAGLALQADSGAVRVVENRYLPAQRWVLKGKAGRYVLRNEQRETLIVSEQGDGLSHSKQAVGKQRFRIEPVDGMFYQLVTPDGTKALELQEGNLAAGTRVGLGACADTPTDYHRQWQLVRLP